MWQLIIGGILLIACSSFGGFIVGYQKGVIDEKAMAKRLGK